VRLALRGQKLFGNVVAPFHRLPPGLEPGYVSVIARGGGTTAAAHIAIKIYIYLGPTSFYIYICAHYRRLFTP
jgi:hypothetical protein